MKASTLGLLSATVVLLIQLLCSPGAEAEPRYCVASYRWLSPRELLGWDGCGAVWKMVLPIDASQPAPENKVDRSMARTSGEKPECWILDWEQGIYYQFDCIAPGDTVRVMNSGEK